MRIAICDDDKTELSRQSEMISKYLSCRPELNASITCFSSPFDLNDRIAEEGGFNVYFLDVMMPHMNGIDLAQRLRRSGDRAPIIYLTSSPDFAVDSYEVNAFGYLLKPVQEDALASLLDELSKAWLSSREQPISIRTATGMATVYPCDLKYIEASGHALVAHLTGQRIVKSITNYSTLDEITAPLKRDIRFVKISRSQIVNMSFISQLTGGSFEMDDGTKLQITRRLLSEVKTRFIDFIFNRRAFI